ncbi:coiled-coil domain-containing protein 18 isoform X2 [Ananas comosus]|uniref:Coiled-coil domain-containing protein 18 isoform X2 n=1 Tax=Ananas comosus TaxID=4615 RepID=A0A6P5FFL7_ANACO|nr:coiled-coil domain-containing protein 18 isoform X2 [Ananas comosus]
MDQRPPNKEVDERGIDMEILMHRVEQLQRERDELRRDIEQLCMQQAGPSYLSVVNQMQFQSQTKAQSGFRTAALGQEIENLQRKLAGSLREKKNLEEELAEAYRIKSQLADLYTTEMSKNNEAEKQVKFFQSSIAAAYAERDKLIMECEEAKEREKAMSKELLNCEERIEKLQSEYLDEKRSKDALRTELTELKNQTESFVRIVTKFYEVRGRDTGHSSDATLEEKCSCLIDDSPDYWIFSKDGESSSLKYIASLKEEKESLKKSIEKLQSSLQMGVDIEQHQKRKVRSLENKHIMFTEFIQSGLSTLQNFYSQQRLEILKTLEEEESYIKAVILEVLDKMNQIQIKTELNIEALHHELQNDESECRDVHISCDVNASHMPENSSLPTSITNETPDESKALAQAMKEKVDALLLLSQQEERYLLERDTNKALQQKIGELQKNLFQVTHEKVQALLELANLKQEFQRLQEYNSNSLKHGSSLAGDPVRSSSTHDREGKLMSLWKKTSLKRWTKKDHALGETDGPETSDANTSSSTKTEHSVDIARLKVENATLQERIANLEHLTSTIRRLHISLLKAHDDVKSAVSPEGIYEALNSIITEASVMKTAFGTVIPISWTGDASDAITYESLYEPTDSSDSSKTEKADPMSSAGLEMLELLILAAELLKESLMANN